MGTAWDQGDLASLRVMLGNITQWTYELNATLRAPRSDEAGWDRLTLRLGGLLDKANVLLDEFDGYAQAHPRAGLCQRLMRAHDELELARAELCDTPCQGENARCRCTSAHARLLELLGSLELALARAEAGASMLGGRQPQLLRQLLDARCGYCMLRAGLLHAAQRWPGRSGQQQRLRIARCWLSCMLDIIPQQGPRVLDYLEIDELHARLNALTAASGERGEAIEQALRDAILLGEDLMTINTHPALIEHDRWVLGLLLTQFDACGRLPKSLLGTLETLRGRDAGLDHLLETRTEPCSELWRDVAVHVLHDLSELTR